MNNNVEVNYVHKVLLQLLYLSVILDLIYAHAREVNTRLHQFAFMVLPKSGAIKPASVLRGDFVGHALKGCRFNFGYTA